MHIWFSLVKDSVGVINYASPSSWDAYSDWQLTRNFELWHEMFCVSTCFHMTILKLCLSVRTQTKENTLASSISVLQLWIHRWKGLRVLAWKPQNLIFFSKKVEIVFWLVPKCWIHPCFVNISPTVVIGTSLEKFSRIPKNLFFFLNAYLSVSAVMFCKQFLAYAVHIDGFTS